MPFTFKTDEEAEGGKSHTRGRASLLIGKGTGFLETTLTVWQDGVKTS